MGYAKRRRKNNKWGGGEFNALPRQFTRSQVLARLGPFACKLFLDLQASYTGFNNGDLSIVWKKMRQRGWRSKATLAKATKELLEVELIERTRQGHRRQCHLYVLTLYDIDDCNGKIDVNPTSAPRRSWLKHEPVRPIHELQEQFKAKQKARETA